MHSYAFDWTTEGFEFESKWRNNFLHGLYSFLRAQSDVSQPIYKEKKNDIWTFLKVLNIQIHFAIHINLRKLNTVIQHGVVSALLIKKKKKKTLNYFAHVPITQENSYAVNNIKITLV
jgi:hypothetical protein